MDGSTKIAQSTGKGPEATKLEEQAKKLVQQAEGPEEYKAAKSKGTASTSTSPTVESFESPSDRSFQRRAERMIRGWSGRPLFKPLGEFEFYPFFDLFPDIYGTLEYSLETLLDDQKPQATGKEGKDIGDDKFFKVENTGKKDKDLDLMNVTKLTVDVEKKDLEEPPLNPTHYRYFPPGNQEAKTSKLFSTEKKEKDTLIVPRPTDEEKGNNKCILLLFFGRKEFQSRKYRKKG